MAGEPRHYLAYLLRLWHVTTGDGARAWRASIEDVHTGACQGFGSLEQMLAFLLDQTTGTPSPNADPESPSRNAAGSHS